jgi:hypothetical protein
VDAGPGLLVDHWTDKESAMKKTAKKLTLAKETLRDLESITMSEMEVRGGLSYTCYQISDCGCIPHTKSC